MSEDTARTVEADGRFVSDLWRIGFILLITLSVRVWVVSHSVVTSRDSLGFIRYALQLEDPPAGRDGRQWTRLQVVKFAEHPPGYYSTVLLISYPVRAIMGGTSCDSMVMSTQVSSVLAALLLTFPMYFLGKRVFDRQTAFVATLLFQSLPVWAAITSDGLSDGLFLLMAVTTLWFGARAFQTPSVLRFLCTGISAGLAYLVRPEGILLLGAAGCTITFCMVLRRWNWRPGTARLVALGAGALLVGLPYVVLIGKLTNKPTGEGLTNAMMGLPPKPSWQESNVLVPQASSTLFAVWWSEIHNGGDSKKLWAFKQVHLQILKTLHYGLPFLALFGFYINWRKIAGDSSVGYLMIQLAIYLAALLTLAIVAGYISERHTLLISVILTYFAAAALPQCGQYLARIGPLGRNYSPQTIAAALAFCLLLCSLPADFKRLHANRAGHRAAGAWLAQHLQPNEEILDIFAWAEFYTGRNMKVVHDNFAFIGEKKAVYVIMEPREPHSRLTNINEAKDIASRGQPVYSWPEGNPDKATVIIYRWDPQWK